MKTARVPAGPILSTADIVAEEQYQQRGMFQRTKPPSGEGSAVCALTADDLDESAITAPAAMETDAVGLSCKRCGMQANIWLHTALLKAVSV